MATDVEIRPVSAGDGAALRAFFERVPDGDRTFFREDVRRPDVLSAWLAESPVRRHVAVDGDGGAVVGYVAVLPATGWSSHVGELRLVVDPARRRAGLGRALARYGLVEGVQAGLSKLVVEVVAEQEATVAMFMALGFEAEALLRDHVRAGDGSLRDLIVLAHFVDDTWAVMETVGIADLLGGG
jgi:ribosomal protein S18 acetylase RimI-like enzyme